METQTLLFIGIAFGIAVGVVWFQYGYLSKETFQKKLIFGILRFLSIFTILILLINPTYVAKNYYEQKPTLVVAVDHTASVSHLNQDQSVRDIITKIKEHDSLQNRFHIKYYSFSDVLRDSISYEFTGKQTNITQALEALQQVYKNAVAPIVLVSDGNQTLGVDYQYKNMRSKQPIYPIILGDTTTIVDTKIKQLNVNRYAYLKNDFPIEVILTYSGDEILKTEFSISQGDQKVYTTPVTFSKSEHSKTISVTLPANHPGIQHYKAYLTPSIQEKNKINNTKHFAIEVIDQKSKVVLISTTMHPDLGMIKKSIESNERSIVTIQKPSKVETLEAYQFAILYNPNSRFSKVYDMLKASRKNYFTLAGTHTDWNFLNVKQNSFRHELSRQTEEYLPRYNPNFGTFLTEDIQFDSFPPLLGTFGEATIGTTHDILVYRTIGEVTTSQPLLATMEYNGTREAVLFGEGIWKWRAQAYKNSGTFENFDNFFGKITQYLISNTKKSRLAVRIDPFYYGNASIIINASYFTKNYEFDRRGDLSVLITNTKTKAIQTIPMVLKNNTYEADLSGLPSGAYKYMVSVTGETITASGTFSVLAYDVEQQFLNADVYKMQQVAKHTKGASFFADQTTVLLETLMSDKRYQSIQKSRESIVSLIDWKYLLGILIALLAIEWFLRKYNGLI